MISPVAYAEQCAYYARSTRRCLCCAQASGVIMCLTVFIFMPGGVSATGWRPPAAASHCQVSQRGGAPWTQRAPFPAPASPGPTTAAAFHTIQVTRASQGHKRGEDLGTGAEWYCHCLGIAGRLLALFMSPQQVGRDAMVGVSFGSLHQRVSATMISNGNCLPAAKHRG
jgi:hypothetical protein